MSISCIDELKKELIQELNTMQELNISAEKIKQLDITGIQLIYALEKEARLQGKQAHWKIELDSEQQERIELIGLGEIINNEI